MFKFELSQKQAKKALEFIEQCQKEHLEEQRKTMSEKEFDNLTCGGKYPYTGAIGGGATYKFTPTSLGVLVSLSYFDKEICLTDFNEW